MNNATPFSNNNGNTGNTSNINNLFASFTDNLEQEENNNPPPGNNAWPSNSEVRTAVDNEDGNWPSDIQDDCLLYTSPSPRDRQKSRMPSSA